MPDSPTPLFIFSPRHSDTLARLSGGAGWQPVFSVDPTAAVDDFSASGAWVAVIDARHALGEAKEAIAALGPAAEARRSALLLILSEGDAACLPWFRQRGATHFLLDPRPEEHFVESVNFAAQLAERLSGGRRRELRGTRSPSALYFTGSEYERRLFDRPSAPMAKPRSERHDRLVSELADALVHDEIEILYQPQVAIVSGRIVGAEALARWQHPHLGEIGAEPLLAAAEDAGLLVRLSTHIQDKALTEIAAWPEDLSTIRVSVNITARDIVTPDFAERFLARVDAKGVRRSCVAVEVTESGLIEELDLAARQLARFREAGIQVAIDDFGTGYSSLAYLKALPVDCLKLDKKLVDDITRSSRDRIVVRSVIDMARSLGLGVVAEGVETEDQLALLAAEGCTISQGFLHSPPVTGAALQALVLEAGESFPRSQAD